MRAMLLAAGMGLRMLPLTLRWPKAAVPVLGRPLAAQLLHRLARSGVDRVVVNLHRHARTLRRVLESEAGKDLPRIDFSHEETILGTAGGLRHAAALLRGDGPIIVQNSDSLADVDIAGAMGAHRRSGHAATLVVAPARTGYATVDVNAAGQVVSLAGRPAVDEREVAGSYLFTGVHIIEEQLLDRIPPRGPSHIVQDVYRYLAAEGRLGHYFHRGFWWEFGSPGRYLEGCLRLLRSSEHRRAVLAGHDPVRERDGAVVAGGEGVKLGHGAGLAGCCALGRDVRVGAGSRLEDCVLFAGTRLGSGCRLTRAVVGPGAELPDGFEAREIAVCADAETDLDLPEAIERRGGLAMRKLERVAP